MYSPKPKTKYEKLITTISVIASVIATLGVLVTVISSTVDYRTKAGLSPFGGANEEFVVSKAQVNALNSEIIAIKKEQARLNDQINSLSSTTSPNTLAVEVVGLRNSANNVDQRLTKIEGIIVQDPQKALEIPLLRKDLDNLVSKTDLQIALLRQDIERSYNLMLVTIVALTVAVLAPALGNIFRKDEKEKDKE